MRWAFAGRRIESIVGSPHFRHAVTALILINALIVGLETILKCALCIADRMVLYLFTAELALRFLAANPPNPPSIAAANSRCQSYK
jgi:hypothetical protein